MVGGKHYADLFSTPVYTCSGQIGIFVNRGANAACYQGGTATLVGYLSP
jgi:hypothetical protein